MIDETLITLTESGKQVVGKILGNPNSDKILICSHGFGVDSNSSGMFSLITEMYKDSYLTIKFHYVSKDDFTGDTYVHPFSIQKEKLRTVIEKVTKKYPGKTITLLSHSQGCFISSMYLKESNRKIDQVIMLAPPLTTDLVKKMTSYFLQKQGTKINIQGKSILKRSVGNNTYVPKEFWEEADNFKPLPLYKELNNTYKIHFIVATKDTVLDVNTFEQLRSFNPKYYYELPNDHNFNEDKWLGLLGVLKDIL